MTPEQRFFIQTLADHLHCRPTQAPEGLDWAAISRLARNHQVDGILYFQCQRQMPEKEKEYCKIGYSESVFYYRNRIWEMQRIGNALRGEGIPFFAVKGLETARYYPQPALRTMGDCDIVVSPADKSAAIRLIRGLGFTGTETEDAYTWNFHKAGMHFELHELLVKNDEFATKKQEAFFHDFMPHVKDGVLDVHYHFLFLLIHLRKHFINSGVGIRQFMDVAAMLKNGTEIDWNRIERLLEELDLARFAHVCYSLCEAWFGVACPGAFQRLDGETCAFVTEKVLGNGVFGFHDQSNRGNVPKNSLVMKQAPRWATRLNQFLFSLFPDYDVMVQYPGCGFLRKRRYLLPAAWVKRFVYLLREGDFQRVKETVGNSFIPSKALDERAAFLEKMGIVSKKKR